MSTSSSKQREQANKDTTILHEPTQDGSARGGDLKGAERPSAEGGSLLDSLVLVCGETKLRLYDMKSVIQVSQLLPSILNLYTGLQGLHSILV